MKPPDTRREGGRRMLRAHIWLVATVIPLLDKLLPMKPLLVLLTPLGVFRPYAGTPANDIAGLVARRLRQPRHMRRRACLRHGLTLFHFLRLAGWPAVLRIGVFPPSVDRRRLHAHCWVTLDGVALSPPPEQPLATLVTCGARDISIAAGSKIK